MWFAGLFAGLFGMLSFVVEGRPSLRNPISKGEACRSEGDLFRREPVAAVILDDGYIEVLARRGFLAENRT